MSADDIQPNDRVAHESGFAIFLEPDHARRVGTLLGSAKGRLKVIAMLAHALRFAPKKALRIPANEQSSEAILARLRRAGAGATCYVMSEQREWDGSFMPLANALSCVIGAGYGTFLSCVPGKLGYYEAEAPGERYILTAPAVSSLERE